MITKANTSDQYIQIKIKGNSLTTNGPHKLFMGYKMFPSGSKCEQGIFAEWEFSNNCLRVTNDEFGCFPIYYLKDSAGICVSSSIISILKVSNFQTLNDSALAIFFRTGNFTGNYTPFKNIFALSPGTTLTWTRNKFSLQEDKKIETGGTTNMSRSAAIKYYGEVFQAGVEKYQSISNAKIAVPLSGGRDSRHVLFALLRAGINPHACLTMKYIPPNRDEDAEVAAKVCSALGVPIRTIDQSSSFLLNEVRKNEITGFCSHAHAWVLPLAQYLGAHKYKAVFDGFGGGMLSSSSWTSEERIKLYESGNYIALAENILGSEGYVPKFLTKSAYKRFSRESAIPMLIEDFKKYAHTPNPIGQYYFWNRNRRHVALCPWRIMAQKCPVFAPFLDKDVYKFLASLPASYLFSGTFHTEAISNFYPEHAHLAYETKLIPKNKGSLSSTLSFAWSALKFFSSLLGQDSIVDPKFIYSRISKALMAPSFGIKLISVCRRSIYAHQLEKVTWDSYI